MVAGLGGATEEALVEDREVAPRVGVGVLAVLAAVAS